MMKTNKYSLIFLTVILALIACRRDSNVSIEKSKTFLLVHGAWQASFVWDSVKINLEAAGNKVVVIDLPAHGVDTTSPAAVTMNIYRDKVINALNSINGKVILVGHSMGGVVITAAAEMVPKKIEKLIYIGAFLPANNQSLLDLAGTDAKSLLGPSIIPTNGGLTLDVNHENITQIFCQDGTPQQKLLILNKFKVEPAIPFGDKVTISEANFGSVDKYYIHTAIDNAVGIDLQNSMAEAAHITKQYSLHTGHCPFITDIKETSQLLLQIQGL